MKVGWLTSHHSLKTCFLLTLIHKIHRFHTSYYLFCRSIFLPCFNSTARVSCRIQSFPLVNTTSLCHPVIETRNYDISDSTRRAHKCYDGLPQWRWVLTSESSTRTRAGTRTLEHGFKAGASSNNVTTSQRKTNSSKMLSRFDSVYKACGCHNPVSMMGVIVLVEKATNTHNNMSKS